MDLTRFNLKRNGTTSGTSSTIIDKDKAIWRYPIAKQAIWGAHNLRCHYQLVAVCRAADRFRAMAEVAAAHGGQLRRTEPISSERAVREMSVVCQ